MDPEPRDESEQPAFFIDLYGLEIDIDDPERFYPRLSIFTDYQHRPTPWHLTHYDTGVATNKLDPYEIVYKLIGIITDDASIHIKEKALSLLPLMSVLAKVDLAEMIDFVTGLDEPLLELKKIETIARLYQAQSNYYQAIELYETIINDPEIRETARLLVEYEQALCYHLLNNSDTRSAMPKSTRAPQSNLEYLKIREDIIKKISQSSPEENPTGDITPDVGTSNGVRQIPTLTPARNMRYLTK